MKIQRRTPKRGRVEIIPMIDTILILLIFYMSFSTFSAAEKRIDSRLPLIAKSSTKLIKPGDVPLDYGIHVYNKDRLTVNGAESDVRDLREAMLQLASYGQKTTIVIEAEPDTIYQAVISVLDVCAQANMTNVAFRPLAEKVAAPH